MTNINNDLNIFKDENGNAIYVTKKDNKVFFDLEEAKKYCKEEHFNDFYKNNTIMYRDDTGWIIVDVDSKSVLLWLINNKEFLTDFLTKI